MARRSLYAKLKDDLMPQYGKRGIGDDETIQMLLSMLYQHTGIAYVQESGVGVRAKAYSEGYEVGRAETRRAYEGKRYTEVEMDKHGQYKYQEGYEEGKRVQEAVKRSITPLFPTEAAVTVVYDNGYRDGVEEGKRQYDWLRKQAEAKYKDLKVKYDKLEQEIKAIERCADTAYDKGYLNGCQEAEEKCAAQRQLRYQQGYDQGIKDSWNKLTGATGYTQGLKEGYEKGKEEAKNEYAAEVLGLQFKHELALDIKWKEGYQVGKNEKAQAYHDGYSEGKQAGLKQSAAQYMQGVEDGRVHGSTESARNKRTVDIRQAHDEGFADGYVKGKEEGVKGKEKFATDRAEEAYSKGYRIGLEDGIRQGKKEVVDFINNMKVSQ